MIVADFSLDIIRWQWLLLGGHCFECAGSQPSLVSRIVPSAAKGAVLGVYNTMQALGLFCGDASGVTS